MSRGMSYGALEAGIPELISQWPVLVTLAVVIFLTSLGMVGRISYASAGQALSVCLISANLGSSGHNDELKPLRGGGGEGGRLSSSALAESNTDRSSACDLASLGKAAREAITSADIARTLCGNMVLSDGGKLTSI